MNTLPARLDEQGVINTYRRIAPLYDLWSRLTESRAHQQALEAAQIRNGESVLEVAAGTGLMFKQLVQKNLDGDNQAVDLCDAMLDRARRRLEGIDARSVNLQIGDAHQLPFEDQRFDLLMNNYMFDLLPESAFARILSEFRRVLKPGGRLVLINMTQAERIGEGLYSLVYRLNPKWMGGCRGVTMSQPLSDAGFVEIERQRLSQMRFPSEIITARCPDEQ